jgi:hypothetical protein
MFAASTVPALKKPGVIGLFVIAVTIGAAWLAQANGPHAIPFVWVMLALAASWALLELSSSIGRAWAPAAITIGSLLATYLCISPNCGVPKYNLTQDLNQPAPLDPQRLYLSVYPAPEDTYRLEKKPEPFGAAVRPGSTSMWSGIRFVNGYSPIRPAGVARQFAFAIHGEIDPAVGSSLLEWDSGPNGMLARLGVDGIVVAKEVATDPQPAAEWELAGRTKEGRVFHRRGEPLPAIRSIATIDSRPNEQFAIAGISRITNGRDWIQADVMVPAGDQPALVTIARPFFAGYRAKLGTRELRVDSYHGLFPIVEIPPATSGRFTMIYQPPWLFWGGGISILCFGIVAVDGILAIWQRRRLRSDERTQDHIRAQSSLT